jgi:hypothetical protein
MLLIMLAVGVLCTAAGVLVTVIPFPYPDPWVFVGNILQFQLWRLFVYIIFFASGIWAYSRGWFVKVNFSGHPIFWISICTVLCFGYVVIAVDLMSNLTDKGLFLMFIFIRSFLRVTFLTVFTSFALRYWNRPHWINETLASNSYNIYLVHQPIVIVFQLLLVNLADTSSFIKFGMVFVSTFF